jgi:hypothetical protein
MFLFHPPPPPQEVFLQYTRNLQSWKISDFIVFPTSSLQIVEGRGINSDNHETQVDDCKISPPKPPSAPSCKSLVVAAVIVQLAVC